MQRNPTFCFLVSLPIALRLIRLMTSSISLFEIGNAVVFDP